MSKVLVDPAALEEAAKWLEVHSSSSGSSEAFAAEALREAIAQPAEVKGVVIAAKCVNRKCLRHNAMLSDYGLTLPHGEALVRQSDHLAALSAVTAERDRLRGTVEDLELALQDAEERAENAGRNASAFEDRMGDLQVENGRLQDRIRPLMAFTQQMARQEGEPYFQRLARAAMAAKEA